MLSLICTLFLYNMPYTIDANVCALNIKDAASLKCYFGFPTIWLPLYLIWSNNLKQSVLVTPTGHILLWHQSQGFGFELCKRDARHFLSTISTIPLHYNYRSKVIFFLLFFTFKTRIANTNGLQGVVTTVAASCKLPQAARPVRTHAGAAVVTWP